MSDFVIKNVRVAFVKVFTPEEYQQGDGRPRYSITSLVVPGSENDKLIRAKIDEAGKETYGAKWPQMHQSFKGQSSKYCYLDGASQPYEGFEGMLSLSAHRQGKHGRPIIIDRDMSALAEADGRPYGGCYCNVKVSIYVQKSPNPGVRASFSVVQFVKDGDAFSGARPSLDGMADLSDGADADAFGEDYENSAVGLV